MARRRSFAYLIAGAAVVASVFQSAGTGVSAATAPALVQGANTVGSGVALTKAVTASDLLVAGITTNDSGTDPVTGVSDNINGAWTRASSVNYGNGHVDLYYLQNSKAGSVTVTLAGGGGAVTVGEYSGIATTSALDQVTNGSGSSSSLQAGPTAAIGGAGELVVGVGGQTNVGSGLTAGGGFTLRESAVSNWWAVNGLEDSLSSSTAGQSMTMTSGSSQYFGAVVAVFKAGTPGGAPVAALTLSPVSTPVNQQVTANASASTPGTHAISTYTFTFGDGTTVGPQAAPTATHTYTKGGVYTVTVTVTDTAGVSAAATAQETVGQPAAALSVSPSSGSAPLPVTASAAASSDATGVSISTYSFNFGDGSAAVSGSAATAAHTYASTGNFTVTVTVTDSTGATSTATASVNVEHGPTAALSLSPASGQAPLPVTANATASAPGSNPISSYTFNFGDGSAAVTQSSPTPEPAHTYTTGGTYTVTVTVTDSAGLTSTATAQEQVTAAPGSTPNFVQGGATTSTSLTLSKPITGGDLLVAGITTGGSQVSGVSDSLNGAWTAASSLAYGNGYEDLYYLQNSKAGTVTVTVAGSGALTVAEYSGVAATAALDQVAGGSTTGSTLKAGPTAAIGEAGELVVGVGGQTYAGTGFSAGTGFTLRESALSNWLYAGGLEDMSSSSAAGQSMTMGSGGSGYGGAIVAVFKATPTSKGPTAALTLTPTSTTVSQTVTASASGSKAGSNSISTYSFAFGDGTTVGPQSTATATHAYATGGIYTVTVTVTDSIGLTSTATAQETVGQPKAALTVTPSSGNAPLAVTANASASTDTAGISITGYSFNFGDGSATVSGTSSTAAHTYTTVGSRTVTVTVTDSTGATSTATAPVSVANGPTAALTLSPASGKAPLAVTANATGSTAGSNPISSYKFSFGDGSAAVTQSAPTPEPTHTYTVGGTYTVSVTVTDSAANTSTATAQALVGQPSAALTVTPASAPLTVTANASASTDPLGIGSYTFAFGDGTTAGPQGGSTTTHAYSSAGTYTVTVTITDSAGATSTASAKVTVTTPPTAALTVTPTSGIAPLPVTANATASAAGSSPMSSYTFSFGDGSAAVTQSSPTPEPVHTYTATGTFTVQVTVTDTSGVSATATASVVVSPAYIVQDTFQRSNQSGWGTASGGGTWAQELGTASSTSVAGDEGTISNSSSSDYEILGSATAADANGLVRFSVGAANDTAGIILRYESAGNMDLARFGGSGNLEFMVQSGGTWTIVENTSVSVSVNTFYWLRFEVQGSNVYLKLWPYGTTEPSSWTWSGTSSVITGAGTMGLYGWAAPGAPVEFDSFSVAAVSGSTGPNNSTITGSVTSSAAAPIAGVQVSTVPATTTATTSASGAYSLAVPAATYTVVYTGAAVGYNANFTSGVVAPANGSVSAGLEKLAAIPAQEAMDNFTQPNQTGGWSPSTDGSTWNSDLGTINNGVVITSSQVGVAGEQGFVDTGESTGADYDTWMGYQYANQVVSAQLEITSIVSDPANAHGARLLARVQQLGANDDDTLVEMTVDPYNTSEPAYPNGDLSLWVAVNGSWTELAIQGTTISLNTLYDAQLEVVGNVVEGSVWPAGATQPGWMIQGTQTALTGAGQAGTRTTGSNVTWSSFSEVPITQISGTVTASATGTPIAGATVTLTGGASTTTDANGNYSFSGLTGGANYTVTVSATGYTTEAASVSPATGTTAAASVALPSASGSCATGGLTTSTQIQSGVTNGPPNNQTETDYTYIDGSGNGWRVGAIPGYGGANIAMWYEVDGCTVGPTQTSLDTTSPSDLAHDYTQSPSNNFVGSENSPYTEVQMGPSIPSFRAGMQATVPSTGVDTNGFVHTVTTYVYPGNPGFIVDRFDITNPSSSPILLSPTQPLQFWTISGLEQANSTWAAANGGYGTVGGSSVQGLPTSATPGAPDYFYIDPASGSGVSDGVAAALATNLSSLGLANLQIEALVNGNRLKIGVFGDNSVAGQDYSFPAGTTITFYLLQTISRNLTSAQAESIAADYLNPDAPTMTTGSFDGFSEGQGLYTFTGSGNTVTFTPTFSSTVQERWLDVYAVDGYTSTSLPTVSIGGVTLTEGTQYIAAVDTTDHVAYVKLMEPLVPGAPGTGQLQSGPITIS